MKISLKSPEKEAPRKTPVGSRIPSQFLKAKRTSGSRVPRTAEMALDMVEPRLSEDSEEEEEELVIDELRRRGRGREAGGGVVTQMMPSLGALQVRSCSVQSPGMREPEPRFGKTIRFASVLPAFRRIRICLPLV